MGTAQFSEKCHFREPFHRATLESYFHSSDTFRRGSSDSQDTPVDQPPLAELLPGMPVSTELLVPQGTTRLAVDKCTYCSCFAAFSQGIQQPSCLLPRTLSNTSTRCSHSPHQNQAPHHAGEKPGSSASLLEPTWSITATTFPCQGCGNPNRLHFMGWDWTVNTAVESKGNQIKQPSVRV